MLKTWISALFVFLIINGRVLSDDFVVTATNLDASPILNANTVSVQAFKLKSESVNDLGLNVSVDLIRGAAQLTILNPSVALENGKVILRFSISPEDVALTEAGNSRNKVVILVFTRDGQQVIVPSIVLANTTQVLAVALPASKATYEATTKSTCPTPCIPERKGGILHRLFRHCR